MKPAQQLAKALRDEGSHIDAEELFEEQKMEEKKLVKVLLNHGANVDAQETQVPETVNG